VREKCVQLSAQVANIKQIIDLNSVLNKKNYYNKSSSLCAKKDDSFDISHVYVFMLNFNDRKKMSDQRSSIGSRQLRYLIQILRR